MELRHLRYFVAVAEEENISRAAARLHISQPPLSRQIRDLEDELGVELFHRTAKSLRLTEPGKVFLAEARAVLLRVDVAVGAVQAAAREQRSEFHLGYSPSPTGDFLPDILKALEKALPDTRVRLHDMTSEEMLAALRAKRIQAGLLVEQPGARKNRLAFLPLRSYRAGMIVPRDHAFAKRRWVTLDDVLEERVAVYSKIEYPDYHDWLRKIFGAKFRNLRVAIECDGAMSMIAAVEGSRMIAVAAESILSVAGPRAVFVPFRPAPAPLVVGVCRASGAAPHSPTDIFVRTAQKAAARRKSGGRLGRAD